ncbi:hypothetical protein D1007_02820 [Hordeum vulgare]|nr:hypothetical protein D1007_02820 [Hordeum vulgare]
MREATGGRGAGASSSSAASNELMELRYPPGELDIVFWCPPGKTILEMVAIDFEVDCLKMAKATVNSKVLVLFVKHVKTTEIKKLEEEEDDIAYRVGPELPEVILSPMRQEKRRHMKKKSNTATTKSAEDADSSDKSSDAEEEWECDSEHDPTWYDSDYAVDDDDDLYDKNVDDVVKDALLEKGKKVGAEYRHVPGTDDVTEEELQLPEEDDCEKMQKSDSDDEEYMKKKKKEKPIYRREHVDELAVDTCEHQVYSVFIPRLFR